MSWNIWWRFGDHERRYPAILDVLRREAPDVVCLQEVWARHDESSGAVEDQMVRLADDLGWHAVPTEHVWHRGLAFGNAVLSRWPLDVLADERLPAADGRPGHRRALVASVASPWGPWPFLSTHLDHRFDASTARRVQLHRVLELVVAHRGDPERDLPVVLGGDLNAVPDSDEIRMVTGRAAGGPGGVVLSDVWEQVGEGSGITWRRDNPYVGDSAWPDRRIDYLMVSWPRPKPVGNPVRAWLAGDRPENVTHDDGSTRAVWPSDHIAVVAELRTPDGVDVSAAP